MRVFVVNDFDCGFEEMDMDGIETYLGKIVKKIELFDGLVLFCGVGKEVSCKLDGVDIHGSAICCRENDSVYMSDIIKLREHLSYSHEKQVDDLFAKMSNDHPTYTFERYGTLGVVAYVAGKEYFVDMPKGWGNLDKNEVAQKLMEDLSNSHMTLEPFYVCSWSQKKFYKVPFSCMDEVKRLLGCNPLYIKVSDWSYIACSSDNLSEMCFMLCKYVDSFSEIKYYVDRHRSREILVALGR